MGNAPIAEQNDELVGCLDADTLAALFAGELTVEECERAEAHADECDTCRGCIAALARARSTCT